MPERRPAKIAIETPTSPSKNTTSSAPRSETATRQDPSESTAGRTETTSDQSPKDHERRTDAAKSTNQNKSDSSPRGRKDDRPVVMDRQDPIHDEVARIKEAALKDLPPVDTHARNVQGVAERGTVNSPSDEPPKNKIEENKTVMKEREKQDKRDEDRRKKREEFDRDNL